MKIDDCRTRETKTGSDVRSLLAATKDESFRSLEVGSVGPKSKPGRKLHTDVFKLKDN